MSKYVIQTEFHANNVAQGKLYEERNTVQHELDAALCAERITEVLRLQAKRTELDLIISRER